MSLAGGVLPVLYTPFTPDDAIDLGAIHPQVDWMLECGADGVCIGMVSEVLRLGIAERQTLAAEVVGAVGGRSAVVVAVTAESTRLALQLARHAEEVGASATMVAPPVTASIGTEETVRHLRAVVDATTIPCIIQDASGYVGRPLPIEVMARMLADYDPARVLFKPEAEPIGPQLSALLEATAGKARVYEGNGGRSLIESHRRGAVGSIPGADMTPAIVALWRALEAGDDVSAYRISTAVTALYSGLDSIEGFVAVAKRILVRRGVMPHARARAPAGVELDDVTANEIDRLASMADAAAGASEQ